MEPRDVSGKFFVDEKGRLIFIDQDSKKWEVIGITENCIYRVIEIKE